MVEHLFAVSLAITAWYITSFSTLLVNKHILNTMQIQPNTLAVVQMVSTAIYGALKTVHWRSLMTEAALALSRYLAGQKPASRAAAEGLEDAGRMQKWAWRRRSLIQMSFVGGMRFSTVFLGLVSLKYVAASFTETIKASAPFFTVIIAYFMLGEKTTPEVMVSLLPVAGGLLLTTYTELSFNVVGFGAAVATNVIECVQNVFSKKLLASDYTASQLQFYTSLTALALQAPLVMLSWGSPPIPMRATNATMLLTNSDFSNTTEARGLMVDTYPPVPEELDLTAANLAILWIDGVLYHLQSVVAYVVMSYLSPVTVSVVNTLKRALLIWISVLVFGNEVTAAAKLGTAICLVGVLWYNMARSGMSLKSVLRQMGYPPETGAWQHSS